MHKLHALAIAAAIVMTLVGCAMSAEHAAGLSTIWRLRMFSAKFTLAAAGAVAAAAVGFAAPSPAHAAAATPRGCTAPPFFQTWGGHHYFLAKPGARYQDAGDAGQTIGLQITRGTQVNTTYTVTSGRTFGVNAVGISGSAHKDISRAIQNTVTNSTTMTSSYVVKHFAVIQYGAWGYAYNWERGFIAGGPRGCVVHITAKGTARSPASTPGFHRTGS